MHVLKENYEEFERFNLIKDNLLYNENYKKLGQVCEVCGSSHGFLK
jgi:thymidine kinase